MNSPINYMIIKAFNLSLKRPMAVFAITIAFLLASCATQSPISQAPYAEQSENMGDDSRAAARIEEYSQSSEQTPAEQSDITHRLTSSNTSVERIHYVPANVPGDMHQLVSELETAKYDELRSSETTVVDLSYFPEANNIASQDDLWDRIRLGFKLDHDHPVVKGDLQWYSRHQAYLDRVVDRARPYLYFIVEEAEKRNVPLELALLPVVESAFQPFAYSHGRAAGIWQFIPSTGRLYGLKQNWWYDGRRDVYASTIAALKFLSGLSREFKNDWLLALAAYNSGAGTVRKAIRKSKRNNRGTDYWSLRRYLPKETSGYVPKLLAISKIVANPDKFNIKLKSIDNAPFLQRVFFEGQLDLALAAELAGISLDDMYRYNPGFNRWATDPKGPNYLLIPSHNAERFNEKIAALPPQKRTRWAKHRVRSGQTLGQIARKYKTTPSVIKQVNKIRGNMIREGRDLIIPVAVKKFSTYTMTADQRKKNIQNTKRNGNKTIYRVKSGDTLWDISRKYGVGVRQLAKWNAMAPRDPLKQGQKLTIWSKGVKRNDYTASRATPPSDEIRRKINYVVRKGDSLARIAKKFHVTISQLRRWNQLPKNRYLQPGQRIKLFIDIRRQSG